MIAHGMDPLAADLEGSFMDLKQRNVIEVMDMKARQLKKKNDMLVLENDNLRTELKLLCAADKDLHDDFTNSKMINLLHPHLCYFIIFLFLS